ncbi:MAG TPA: M23 family metallopeptidase [Fibrobacter sp.]|nr:M23 family metallopeptidase [Fibrobacter sp.]
MRRRVLESLASQGALVAFVSAPKDQINSSDASLLARSFHSSALSLIIDFQGVFEDQLSTSLDSLFTERLSFSMNISEQDGYGLLTSIGNNLPEDPKTIRFFLQNLVVLQKKYPFILLFLPLKKHVFFEKLLEAVNLLVVAPAEGDSLSLLEETLKEVRFLKPEKCLWLSSTLPDKKNSPYLREESKAYFHFKDSAAKAWGSNPKILASEVKNVLKIQILKRNPLEGLSWLFIRLFPFLFVLLLLVPFILPKKLEPGVSNLRDARSERDVLSGAPYFLFDFDGKETIQRIGRYAVGRFNAQVTTNKILNHYVEEVLEKNGWPKNSWKKDNVNIPPAGTRLQFSSPDFLSPSKADSIGLAWQYFTSLISDSVAYLTELYHETPGAVGRVHYGIDIASRQGARILAPFAAKAWTFKDDRGGVVIGLVHEKKVMLFMHCDQLLYLDGQEVMAGDPIATVGTTGHTTGPHVHLETGVIVPNGKKNLGNVRYKTVNPITWFYSQVKK